MEQLKHYARRITKTIDDPFERNKAYQEIYSSLLDAYDEAKAQGLSDNEASEHVIDAFGMTEADQDALKQAHIRRMNAHKMRQLILISVACLALLYILLLWIFN